MIFTSVLPANLEQHVAEADDQQSAPDKPKPVTGANFGAVGKFLVLNADMVWREIDETPGLQEA